MVVIWFGSPHGPYRGLEKDLALYADVNREEMRHRYAEITALDRAMGRLRTALREMRVANDTLLWYCSDNGIPRNTAGPNANLRGAKGTLYEGGLRVPGIIEWPTVITKPRTTAMPCVTSDIFPTVLDLLGLELPDRPIDGVSLKRLINGQSMTQRPRPIGFWKYANRRERKNKPWMEPSRLLGTTPTTKRDRIQFTNFQHPVPRTDNFGGQAAWMNNRYKLVETDKSAELYDITADPHEKTDLAAKRPDVVKKMKAALHEWQRSVERSLSGADYRK